jgi:hypothetical protein
LNTELFYPAPEGLPVAIRPPRSSYDLLKALEHCDWNSLGKARNGELLRAGALWLYGFLDESHAIAQGIGSAEGSYWRIDASERRRLSNSKYWYRRVGRHAIFPDLLAGRQLEISSQSTMAALLKSADWDPFRFVDAIEREAGHTEDTALLHAIAREEYNLLMGYCLTKV